MRTFAPGKLVLTGAYAVLEGAPAVAVAVSRGACADDSRPATLTTPEVRSAFGDGVTAPHVDASAMFDGERKLGLGASAAILVASLAAREASLGADLASSVVRDRLFARARAAHANAQAGGSGVDVAASIHGGAICYVIGEPVTRIALPGGVQIRAFACSTSARTSELRAAVAALARRDARAHRTIMDALTAIARDGADAARRGDAGAFVDALRRTARGLARLGDAADVGIVPRGFAELEALAAREDAAFLVSGAGGGDVAVHVGPSTPSRGLLERCEALGLRALDLSLDETGVRLAPGSHVGPMHEQPLPAEPSPRRTVDVDVR